MRTIYICSPYHGDIEANTALARKACRYAVKKGYSVICPHLLYPQFLDENNEEERGQGIQAGINDLDHADEVWVIGDRLTDGMTKEMAAAQMKHVFIHFLKAETIEEET